MYWYILLFIGHYCCINVCCFLVDGFGAWDGRNCRVLRETDEEVDCGCDHLTHFAILLVSDSIQAV